MTPKKADVTVIRVVKPAKHGHGHHGGAWKVAYADFVTAMMAFFLVMWIVGMESDVKEVVQGYFSNPVGFKKAYSAGQKLFATGGPMVMQSQIPLLAREYQRQRLEETAERLRERLLETTQLGDLTGQIEIVITEEGLRIELFETGQDDTFFDFGSAEVKPATRRALEIIAAELGRIPDAIVVEGHTDAAPFGSPGYSNWELSVDRANGARRVLESAGIPQNRIDGVRGYADRKLRVPDNPLDPTNRRISILVPFTDFRPIFDMAGSSDADVAEE